jgi:hypothetical protein
MDQERNNTSLPLGKLYKITDAAVVGFFTVFGEKATGYFAGFAMIAHALAAQPAFGTTIRACAIFKILFFQAIHGDLHLKNPSMF